jgi:hypothetical protein
MFSCRIAWRGIVYAILMLFAKLITGVWLVRLNFRVPNFGALRRCLPASWQRPNVKTAARDPRSAAKTSRDGIEPQAQPNATPRTAGAPSSGAPHAPPPQRIDKPLSLYPAAMLGTGMTARGEIGFLIASLAETTGIFRAAGGDASAGRSSDIYLVTTWAIVLCTIVGPLAVGTLVKRVKRLQEQRAWDQGTADPLGIWGVG